MARNRAAHRLNLLGKLARGRYHQKIRTATEAPALPTALFAMRKIVHGWQEECRRFSSTRLSGSQHVAALKNLRDRPSLNGRRGAVAQFLDCPHNLFVKPQVLEAHAILTLRRYLLFLRCICSHKSHFHS